VSESHSCCLELIWSNDSESSDDLFLQFASCHSVDWNGNSLSSVAECDSDLASSDPVFHDQAILSFFWGDVVRDVFQDPILHILWSFYQDDKPVSCRWFSWLCSTAQQSKLLFRVWDFTFLIAVDGWIRGDKWLVISKKGNVISNVLIVMKWNEMKCKQASHKIDNSTPSLPKDCFDNYPIQSSGTVISEQWHLGILLEWQDIRIKAIAVKLRKWWKCKNLQGLLI
jgi:hypothetical protein